MDCIEVNAREFPEEECSKIMQKSEEFTILSSKHRSQICKAIASDVEQQPKDNTCAYIVVNAYKSFDEFYLGLEAELAQWQQDKISLDLETAQLESSKSVTAAVHDLVVAT